MPKSIAFPYGIVLRDSGTIDAFPVAEVFFSSAAREEVSLFLIIDSGATISALPRSDAAVLGVDAEAGIPLAVGGIGGEQLQGWRHEVPVRLGTTVLQLPIAFLDGASTPRVLGREGIFDRYAVVFDEERRNSAFLGNGRKEVREMRRILNRISSARGKRRIR